MKFRKSFGFFVCLLMLSSFLVSIPFLSQILPVFAAKEDYTTYTKVGTTADITSLLANSFTFKSERVTTATYMYYDKGTSHFSNLSHTIDFEYLNGTWAGFLWGIANTLGALGSLANALTAEYYGSTTKFYINEWYGGTQYQATSTMTFSANTWYYATINVTGTAFSMQIYGNSGRTSLLDTLSLTLHSTTAYRYIYACSNHAISGSENSYANIANLNLNEVTYPQTSASVTDFYINNTATGATTGFTFNVSDTVSLANATFMYNNGTGWYTQSNTTLSGTNENVTFTVPPVSSSTTITFNCTVFNTNTTLSGGTTGTRTLAIYSTSMPYTSLGKAVTAVEGANSWTTTNTTTGLAGVDPYQGLILNQNTTAQYESVIDNDAYGSVVVNPKGQTYCTSYFYGLGWTNPYGAFGSAGSPDSPGASYASIGPASYSNTLGFNYSTVTDVGAIINGTSIEYYVNSTNQAQTQMYVYISNDSYSWTNVFGATPTWAASTNLTFSRSIFSYTYFKFYNSAGSGTLTVSLNETRCWSDPYTHIVHDYFGVLQFCAYSEKMNLIWTNKQRDLQWALGNITMLGSLPLTDINAKNNSDFSIEDTWALYGYYYAIVYGGNTTQWNITAAYNQFNASVYWTVANGVPSGMPFWIFGNNTGYPFYDRYYDEDAECIQDFLFFDFLLNQTDGLTQAAYWWNYLVMNHWNPLDSSSENQALQYFRYSNVYSATDAYEFECEAGFFLKITSILKYYLSNMGNYSYVLTDIGLRFLSNEWTSYQWEVAAGSTSYVVVHLYDPEHSNTETRLQNTLAAWQALLGAFVQFNSTYQSNMVDMLQGNTTSAIQPAWSLLMSSTAGLYDSGTKAFKIANDGSETAYASAMGEITLFQLGIVPGTSTVAFPLEELSYEYVNDIDPVLMAFNLNQTARQVTIPVVQAGTITFQYGESPITYAFSASGVYLITFTNSWNMIASISGPTPLPKNVIYFYAPPPTYSNIGTNSTVWATACRFSALFAENYGNLSGFVFGSNNTGVFVNQTWTSTWSNWPTSTSAWANYTVAALNSTDSNATRPEIVQYRWWANSTSNSWTDTGLQTLTLYWPLSTGWNNVTIFSFDVGFTLGGLNASLNYDSISWTYIIYQNSSATAQYIFANGMSYNNLVKVYQTTGILLIFCSAAGNWTHTYPLQGGIYGSDPTPEIITAVALAIVLGIYLVWRRKKKPAT